MNDELVNKFITESILPAFGIESVETACDYDEMNVIKQAILKLENEMKCKLEKTEKERDKAVEMVRAMSHQFGTCDGCKHLVSKCSVSDYWCEKDGEDHWEWEGE